MSDRDGFDGMVETPARLVAKLTGDTKLLCTALPFRVQLSAVDDADEPLADYCGHLTISAVTAKVCLSEGFEGRRLGLLR